MKPGNTKTTISKAITAALFGLAISQPAYAVTDEEFNELRAQFEALASQVEENSESSSSTTIGGYGELHYNNLQSDIKPDKKELDLHRFVLFVNHEFNDDIRFFSEFEIEHAIAGESQNGEVEVEQMYVQFDLNDNLKVNAGVFLIPVGILNETHEPPTFYGVERNPVEKNIIPATWWEGGAMLSGTNTSGFSYDIALSSGLSGGTNIRGGRQKTSKATANNLALTGRAKYTGMKGLEVAATVSYQDDMTQDSSDDINSATLIEAHARWQVANFTLTGLYANWDIDVGNNAAQSDKDKDSQNGGYLEASYKITPKVGIFVRQNQWDNGGAGDTEKSQTDVGINYWPHEDVVLKADYQAQNDKAGDLDGFNLGIGYQF